MSDNKPSLPFHGTQTIAVQAYNIGQRLNVKPLSQRYTVLKKLPLVIIVGGGVAVLFRYAVVVFFGVSKDDQEKFLIDIQDDVLQPFEKKQDVEEVLVITGAEKDNVAFDGIHVAELNIDRILVISDILGKSQILSYHESQIAEAFDKIDPIAADMQRRGHPSSKRAQDLLRHMGTTLSAQRNIAGQAEILDKPDFLWDRPPVIEGFFIRLEDEYEIRERHSALKEKLDLIYRTAETMIGLVNSRHTLKVEWYIVILIIIDIAIHIAETYIF